MTGSERLVLAAVLELLAIAACERGEATSAGALPIARGEARNAPASAAPNVFRVVDWNIAAGRLSSIQAIADKLAALDADLIVLQELDRHTHRTAGIDEPAFLGRALGYSYAFAPIIPWDGGDYGIATFSRYPFRSVERIPLSNTYAEEPRTALVASVCPFAACVRAINHHADIVPLAAELSTREVLARIAADRERGVALLGDLNQIASDPGPRACVQAGLVDLGDQFGDALTEGDRRIDYAFVDAGLAACAQQMRVEPATESDHNLLVIDFGAACIQSTLH